MTLARAAAERHLDDSLAIADAAKQCGFRSTRQFATMFKHVCGVSPARFRRGR